MTSRHFKQVAPYFEILLTRHGGEKIIRSLQDSHIEFFVVGGTALAFHGIRPVTEVRDLDLLLDPLEPDLLKLKSALSSIGIDDFGDDRGTWSEPLSRHISLKTMSYCCDLLTAPSADDFADLVVDAERFPLNGTAVCIAGLRTLRVLLERAIAAGDSDAQRLQDFEALKRMDQE